jgi:hypothetical protein
MGRTDAVKRAAIILDVESRNHLQKDCGGDLSQLRIGLAGVKVLGKDKFLFFDDSNINQLERVLLETSQIIGFNLVGHNGLDYKMLENHGVAVDKMIPKTYDLMTSLIRSFGSYKGLSLDNIAEHTFGIRAKISKKANYRLIQDNQFEQVKANLKSELTIIERLYLRMVQGKIVRFKTSWGAIDQHELHPFAGFHPEAGEDIIDPYDFPFAGMRLQIKDRSDEIVLCKQCTKRWRIISICYYGDTMPQDVYCPNCNSFLIEVRSSLLGEPVKISEVEGRKF